MISTFLEPQTNLNKSHKINIVLCSGQIALIVDSTKAYFWSFYMDSVITAPYLRCNSMAVTKILE